MTKDELLDALSLWPSSERRPESTEIRTPQSESARLLERRLRQERRVDTFVVTLFLLGLLFAGIVLEAL